MPFPIMVALATLIALAAATPTIPASIHDRQQEAPTSTLAPCAQVSVILANNNKAPATVPADLAYECLGTIPLNVTSAKAILFEIPLYLNWQSTLDVLKNPPAEYVEKVQAPVDILAGLDVISESIDSGDITSEYQFGWQLYKLFGEAHDGHLAFILDVIGSVFLFSRPLPLVSVSEDGKKLPAVFSYYDVLGVQFKNVSYTPSHIVKIDGTDVNEYLENLSQDGSLQDRDALYNNLFYNLAQISLGSSGTGTGMFTGGGRGRFSPLAANTTLDFANSSTTVIQNYARPQVSFTNVTSGEDLRRKIVYDEGSVGVSPPPEKVNPTQQSVPEEVAAIPPGYPAPVVPGPSNLINGFYINAPGYEDVAVLAVPNFVSSSYNELRFQAASKQFLAKAWSEGKTKLIIDVQANGGGTILQGYDLFRQIFPNTDPYGGNRFRYNAAFELVGQAYSEVASQYPRDAGLTNYTLRSIQTSYFDYHGDMTADGKPFESWHQKAGPYDVNGNSYGAVTRWNLTDIYLPYQGGINVTGPSNLTRWQPENVVLLTDGYCASTCALFAEMLTQQGRVKTIALGGRSNAKKIQAVGGVKGANVYQWGFIREFPRSAISLNVTLQDSVLKEYEFSRVISRSYSDGINVRDAIRKGDDSGLALQFKYEEADCRLYYTPEMTVSAAAIWKAAADAQWSDSSKCIGSTGGYHSPPYAKRASRGETTTLSPARGQIHAAQALKQFQALENTFSIETEIQPSCDGFMQP
ncbi:hypothetical protein BU23DRAFT_593452 [Bimuria novae-zelandiae CBS 107.79]|uniref:Uncharacterized protein n=1 Tax=Bimuria novae-zelandiae CBS 107.79 TaxID=1447943 RepID=A0A6A5UKU4_9PLEO|nr:hypothetical protein BU23DRAFT_593452 [Bimuria novae-zelandiae CBS 107.79]